MRACGLSSCSPCCQPLTLPLWCQPTYTGATNTGKASLPVWCQPMRVQWIVARHPLPFWCSKSIYIRVQMDLDEYAAAGEEELELVRIELAAQLIGNPHQVVVQLPCSVQ